MKREYASLTGRPYGRVMLLHAAIIAGAVPVGMIGSPLPLVLLLVLVKIAMDTRLHVRSHGKARSRTDDENKLYMSPP